MSRATLFARMLMNPLSITYPATTSTMTQKRGKAGWRDVAEPQRRIERVRSFSHALSPGVAPPYRCTCNKVLRSTV